ncbi:MAG: hypothetical protein MRY64_08235, partial [Hyphomonadaceae bacterium]|nr:hypothetical protein [Hyphomonadaceae bacterium]
IYHFDPRLVEAERWQLVAEQGENDELDVVGAEWGAEAAPDGRLFPDDLSASFSGQVEAEDLGGAWRVRFDHRPTLNDSEFDAWAAQHLNATLWIDPASDRFLRLDHDLPDPVQGPRGVRLMRYSQSHYLATDPVYGLSYVSGLTVELEARAAMRTVHRAYSARILDVELFFASAADQAAFQKSRLRRVSTGEGG